MSAGIGDRLLSPTMARNFAIRSGDNGGTAVWMMFIGVSVWSYVFRRGGAAQPVVDGLAEAVMRDRHHRDGARALVSRTRR